MVECLTSMCVALDSIPALEEQPDKSLTIPELTLIRRRCFLWYCCTVGWEYISHVLYASNYIQEKIWNFFLHREVINVYRAKYVYSDPNNIQYIHVLIIKMYIFNFIN